MKTYIFPAIVEPDDNTVMVTFPDIENCFTCGDDYADALVNAEDALCLILRDREDKGELIPTPRDPASVVLRPGQMLVFIKADIAAYKSTKRYID